MDEFPVDGLFYMVFFAPGEKPIVALVGRGAQALADDVPQLSSILETIKVREPLWQTRSQTAGVLLLHTPGEPAANITKFYEIAQVMFLDLWEEATETPALERTIAPVVRGFLARRFGLGKPLPPVVRKLAPASEGYLSARFPQAGAPLTPIDYARALCAMGRYEKSCTVLKQAIQEEPDSAVTHFQLGRLLATLLKQPEAGVIHLRRAAELVPEKPEIWNTLGIALGMAGQGVESCQAFLQEAALTDDFGAWMNVAQQALDNGLTGKARDAASRAQKHDPLDPHPLLLLAVCARQEKDDAEADRLVAAAMRMRAAALPPEVLSHLLGQARGKQEA